MQSTTSARAVNCWLWRIMIARHAPHDMALKATLWALATFLDADGDGWATQAQIAAAAGATERTVRKKLHEASLQHWVGMMPRGVEGRRFKTYAFRACIPEHIELDDRFQELADCSSATFGDVGPEWLRGSYFRQRPETRSGHEQRLGMAQVTPDRKLVHERPESHDTQDRNDVPERPEGGSDTVTSSVPHTCFPLAGALSRTAREKKPKEKSEMRKAGIRKHLSQGMTPEEVYKAAAGAIPLHEIQAEHEAMRAEEHAA